MKAVAGVWQMIFKKSVKYCDFLEKLGFIAKQCELIYDYHSPVLFVLTTNQNVMNIYLCLVFALYCRMSSVVKISSVF